MKNGRSVYTKTQKGLNNDVKFSKFISALRK